MFGSLCQRFVISSQYSIRVSGSNSLSTWRQFTLWGCILFFLIVVQTTFLEIWNSDDLFRFLTFLHLSNFYNILQRLVLEIGHLISLSLNNRRIFKFLHGITENLYNNFTSSFVTDAKFATFLTYQTVRPVRSFFLNM